MGGKKGQGGFTLVEMVVVIAIIAILAAISCLFYFRNLDRPKAALNAANLRAVRSQLEAELLLDPDHPDDVIDRVLKDAPGAIGMDLPGLSLPPGTPMDAEIGDDGVDTFYEDLNAEDFDDLLGDEDPEENPTPVPEETTKPTEPTRCAFPACEAVDLPDGGYCSLHQLKVCAKSLRDGDILVPCQMEYRDYCRGEHYKMTLCFCKARGSYEKPCSRCGHWHHPDTCYVMVLVQDNSADEAFD